MVLMLVVAMLSGQTIYEWVDPQGQSHFTDDPSTIPQGTRRRETKGAEISVMPATAPAPVAEEQPAGEEQQAAEERAPAAQPQPQPPPVADQQMAAQAPTEVDSCQVAYAEVNQIERRMAADVMAGAQEQDIQGYACQQVLITRGQPNFSMCMAARSQPLPDQNPAMDLVEAQENLRHAQLDGCPLVNP